MTTELAFMLSAKVENDSMSAGRKTLKLEAHVIHLEDGKVRNISGDYDQDHELGGLVVDALASTDMGEQTYGWRVEYHDALFVKLQRAEDMVKVLRKVERGLAKLDERYGPATSFSSYVMRVADVLKVKKFIAWRTRPTSFYDDGDYMLMTSPSSAAYWLEDKERAFFKENEQQ